jgi:hypothetical protein
MHPSRIHVQLGSEADEALVPEVKLTESGDVYTASEAGLIEFDLGSGTKEY